MYIDILILSKKEELIIYVKTIQTMDVIIYHGQNQEKKINKMSRWG